MNHYQPGRLLFGLLMLVLTISSMNGLSAQITDFEGEEQKAYSAYVSGRYEQALNHYIELKDIFQQNPEYRYYIGRCLMELDNNTTETIENLRFAAIKGEQKDAWFFLGKAYHLNADYEKAVYAYKRFLKLGKKSDIRRLKVKEMLAQAENEGRLSPGKDPESKENNGILSATESGMVNETKALAEDENMMHHDVYLTKALNLQLEADSLNRIAKLKRAGLKETDVSEERNMMISEISHLEKESRRIQKEADKLFEGMQKDTIPESGIDLVKSNEFIELKEEINGIKVYQYKTDDVIVKETSGVLYTDTVTYEDIEENNKGPAEDELFFTDRYVYSGLHPIQLRISYPDTLVYHIQLGVFSKKVDHDSFGSIAPIYYDEMKDKGLFKYYAGLFFSYKAAGEAHIIVKSRGYPDSFIVAFFNGEQISLDRAKQIEYAQIKF